MRRGHRLFYIVLEIIRIKLNAAYPAAVNIGEVSLSPAVSSKIAIGNNNIANFLVFSLMIGSFDIQVTKLNNMPPTNVKIPSPRHKKPT